MSISTVTSEALQLKLRELLPSQQGFGTDLSASDTIIPIIDLTTAAEGSTIPLELNNALAFDSQSSFSVTTGTTDIITTTGFWRIFGTASVLAVSSGLPKVTMTDGSTTKTLFEYRVSTITDRFAFGGIIFDFNVFVKAGETVSLTTNQANAPISATVRQIADINGTLTPPSGFSPS